MIVRNGLAASIQVSFSSGLPDGNVLWQVLGPNGAVLDSGSVTPGVDAASVTLPLIPAVNTLSNGSFISYRDVTWSYAVDSAVVNGEQRYAVHARLPLGISPDGVRALLGVSPNELPDDDVPLMEAYLDFLEIVTQIEFDLALDGGINDLKIKSAIEASAALRLIPSMPVRVANTEGSGTNTFKRQEIDWNSVAADLAGILDRGILVVIPTYSVVGGFGALLILASPSTDPITGVTAT